MLRSLFVGALALACLTEDALAQSHTDKSGTMIQGFAPVPNSGTGSYLSESVGTTDQAILAPGTNYYYLDLVNLSPTATICINFGATATISGTSCAAGEVTLPPLWHRSWEGNFVPTDAIHAIASAASTPATVGVK